MASSSNNHETLSQISSEAPTELDDEPPSEVEVFETAPEPFVCVRCPPIVKSGKTREEETKHILFIPSSADQSDVTIESGRGYDPSDDGLYVKSHHSVGDGSDSAKKSINKLQSRVMMETGTRRFVNENKPFKDMISIEWFTSKRGEDGKFFDSFDMKNTFGVSESEAVQYEPPRRGFVVESTIDPSSLIKTESSSSWRRGGRERREQASFKLRQQSNIDTRSGLSPEGMTLEQVQEWKKENLSQLDPFDEDNIDLMNRIKAYEDKMEQNPDSSTKFYPRSDGKSVGGQRDSDLLQFASMDEVLANPRIQMLMLRASGTVPSIKNVRVPLNEREVPMELLNLNKASTGSNKFSSLRGIEAKREKGISVLTKLKEQLLLQSQGRYDRPRTLEDLVHEEESTSILSFGFNLFTATEHKRPLHPVRRERKKVIGSLATGSDIKFIITIMHALNVPVRIGSGFDTESTSPTAPSTLAPIIPSPSAWRRSMSLGAALSDATANLSELEPRVCPFVEVVFQRDSVRTSTAQGPQPTWNETLALNFKPLNDDLSPTNLTKISDSLYLNLFDEVSTPTSSGTSSESEKSIRLERKWLGSLRIPFSTLYLNSKVEGTFCLSVPTILFGYDYESRSTPSSSTTSFVTSSVTGERRRPSTFGGSGTSLNQDNAISLTANEKTYLNIFVTIDPTLQKPEELTLKCDSAEDESLLNYCQKWVADYQTEFPNRNIRTVAIGLTGEWTLVTRYLIPLKPPDELLKDHNIFEGMKRLARFVSMIPNVPDSVVLPGISEVWSTCQEFLDMLMGDEEEHALLLCNYFLYLGCKRSGIVVGSGIPEGPTAYVIVWEFAADEPSLWNPMTGQRFSPRDSFIPLNTIGCIITSDNVFANVQVHDHPNRINYELNRTSNWKPLFGRKFPFPHGLMSIQEDPLTYGSIDRSYVQQLSERIEKHLKESLMKWRSKSRTFFNRAAIQKIRNLLPRLEQKFDKLEISDILNHLKDLLLVHKITGFPLNMPYSDINSVTEAVYATGIHTTYQPKVEFVLAVYIHAYPCNVLSLWVYIGTLT